MTFPNTSTHSACGPQALTAVRSRQESSGSFTHRDRHPEGIWKPASLVFQKYGTLNGSGGVVMALLDCYCPVFLEPNRYMRAS